MHDTLWPVEIEILGSNYQSLTVCHYYNVIFHTLLNYYWYGHDGAQVLLLVWPPQWHGHTDTIIGMPVAIPALWNATPLSVSVSVGRETQ